MGAGTSPAGLAAAGPMFTPSLRHGDVTALTIRYTREAAAAQPRSQASAELLSLAERG